MVTADEGGAVEMVDEDEYVGWSVVVVGDGFVVGLVVVGLGLFGLLGLCLL